MRVRRHVRFYLICALLPLVAACAPLTSGTTPLAPARTAPVVDTSLELNGAPLMLHVSPGREARRARLVIYATGDGGWRGKDKDVFTHLTGWGYTCVGFSAPEYLKHLPGVDGTATPSHVSSDYTRIAARAKEALGLGAGTGVVLVGVSRGADLAVVAAGQPALRDDLDGVVVMGLTREEEYVRRRRARAALELYPYLPRLGAVPLAVIQSTHDNYLPAADARALFGEDTPLRAFHAIASRNHSFGGARAQLYATLHESLDWVMSEATAGGGR